MARKLKYMSLDDAQMALEGRVCFSGQSLTEPKKLASFKKSQGLSTRIIAVGGRAMLGEGDHLGHVSVSFWVPYA